MRVRLEARAEDSRWMQWLSPLLAVLLTLISGVILFSLMGRDPLQVMYVFFISPLSDAYGWSELGVKMAPILLCAVGLAIAFRAQVWNIGAEGQLLMGGLGASAVALWFGESTSAWALPLVIITGMLFGTAWAALAALLRTQFNANEILTTIMLNYIALNLLLWAVHGPLKDPEGYGFPESALFADSVLLPTFGDGRLHIGIVFAAIAVVITWVLLKRSFVGYKLSVAGLDLHAAQFAGFRHKRLIWIGLLGSGLLAGLAGAAEVAGPIGQLIPVISPGYGYAAIIVAFLGRLNPIGIVLSSFLMALIFLGGESAQIEYSLPLALTGVFQGMLLFFLLASDVFIGYRLRFDGAKTATA